MNRLEFRMVEVLKQLKEQYAVTGVKAEFEAEGTRTEELMRLKEISLAADVTLTLKIGGCEAVRDMYNARCIGVDHLVAPMVESPFALQKYLRAAHAVFPEDERKTLHLAVNVETIETVVVFDEMMRIPEIKQLNTVVLGRGDLVESMGLHRKEVDCERVYEVTEKVLQTCKKHGLTTVIGGSITVGSLPFLRRLPKGLLDRYETRKICYSCPEALGDKADQGIELGLEFELCWLSNKRNYYKAIAEEDQKRIGNLQERLGKIV